MQNFDFSDFSADDLVELEKRIKVEKNKRNLMPISKKDLVKDWRIIKLIDERFQDPKYDALTRFEVGSAINSSMYYLCDIALMNYKDYEPRRLSNSKKYTYPRLAEIREKSNAMSIKANTVIEKSTDKYISMFNELSEVFMKYAEKSDCKGE